MFLHVNSSCFFTSLTVAEHCFWNIKRVQNKTLFKTYVLEVKNGTRQCHKLRNA